MNVFVARMWLYCDSTDPAALTEFDKRWPNSLEAQWSTIVVTYDPTSTPAVAQQHLADHLNDLIQNHFGQAGGWPSKDMSGYQSLDNPIKRTDWSVGAGGLHEGSHPVNCQVSGGPQQWSFAFGQGTRANVYVACEWSVADVVP